jgi:hypothetical protein
MHRLSHLLGHLQERLDQPRRALNTPGSTTSRPSRASAIRAIGKIKSAGTAAGGARPAARSSRAWAPKWRILAKIFANPDLPEIDDYYEPFDFDYATCRPRRR